MDDVFQYVFGNIFLFCFIIQFVDDSDVFVLFIQVSNDIGVDKFGVVGDDEYGQFVFV